MDTTTHTNEQLHTAVKLWVDDVVKHAAISGVGGSGKTTAVQQHTEGKHVKWIPNCSEFELYKQLVEASAFGYELIILDDLSPLLFKSPRSSAVLKSLLSTGHITWYSSRTGRGKTPSEAYVPGKVMIIMNGDLSQNEHAMAVLGRCYTIEHLPSGESTLAFAQEKNLLSEQFIKALRAVGTPPYLDIRFVQKLQKTHDAGLNWLEAYRDYIRKQISGR